MRVTDQLEQNGLNGRVVAEGKSAGQYSKRVD